MTEEQNLQSVSPSVLPRLISVADLFGHTWEIYRVRLWIFFGIIVWPMLFSTLVSICINVLLLTFVSSSISYSYYIVLIISLLLMAVAVLFSVLSVVALIYTISKPVSIMVAYRFALTKLFSFVWIGALNTLAILGTLLPFVIYLEWQWWTSGLDYFAGTIYANLMGVVPILALLFIIPGIIVWVWFVFASYILTYEDLRGIDALLKSKAYVRGYSWPVLWRILFLILVGLGISFVAGLLVGMGKLSLGMSITSYNLISQIISQLIAALIIPFIMIYVYVLYYDLANKKSTTLVAQSKEMKWPTIVACGLGVLVVVVYLFFAVFGGFRPAPEGQSARDSKRYTDLLQIQEGIEVYYKDHKEYPALLSELAPKYVSSTPRDPLTGEIYQYELQLNGKAFMACASLETTTTLACATSSSVPKIKKTK